MYNLFWWRNDHPGSMLAFDLQAVKYSGINSLLTNVTVQFILTFKDLLQRSLTRRFLVCRRFSWTRVKGMSPLLLKIPNIPESRLGPNKSATEYLEATKHSRETGWFLHPVSDKSLSAGQISFWLAKAINRGLLGTMGKAHDVRKLSTTLREGALWHVDLWVSWSKK